MQFHMKSTTFYVPDGLPDESALARTTHMAISAHQDDIEIMASGAILECYQQPDQWFTAVVMSDGRGSPRSGLYAHYTDEKMRLVRIKEQKKAAFVGEYGALAMLDYPTATIKDSSNHHPVEDLVTLFDVAHPQVVYTHNLADKHDTHVGVALRVLEAIRSLPPTGRPRQLLGVEVWRNLDWMLDSEKVALDVSAHESLQVALVGVFDSQIAGGKRYDLATLGRRRANATYFEPHGVDTALGLVFAMDLTPLIEDPQRDIIAFVQEHIQRFAQDVADRLNKLL